MKPYKTITDPKAFQIMADETRRKIMYLLRAKEMTVSQIAQQLDLTPQAVYHHIKKLQDASIVEVVREERLGHLIESYYRTTAEVFSFSMGAAGTKTSQDRKILKEQEASVLKALKKLGFKLEFSEKQLDQLIDLGAELEKCCGAEQWEDKIAGIEDLDLLSRLAVEEYAELLSMSDEEFAKQTALKKKVRDLLISLTKK